MFSNWMNELQVSGEHGTECTFGGVSLERKNQLKRFESIHKILCTLEDRQGEVVLVSDVVCGSDIGFYLNFCPFPILTKNDDLWRFIEGNIWSFIDNVSEILSSSEPYDMPEWVHLGLDRYGIQFCNDSQTVTTLCCVCDDLFDSDCDMSEIRNFCDGDDQYCGGSPRCCP